MPQLIQWCAILLSFDIKDTFFMAHLPPEAQLNTPSGGVSSSVLLLDANYTINFCIILRVSSVNSIEGASGGFVFEGVTEAVAGEVDSGTVPKL